MTEIKAQNIQMTEEQYEAIRSTVYDALGINLTATKKAMVVSRLSSRLRALNLNSFAEYIKLFNHDQTEKDFMLNLITTNVTSFFREKHHFDYLINTFLPQLESTVAHQNPNKKIIGWSAGCSTGEEPYTIAMILDQYFSSRSGWRIKIYASDVNTSALDQAKRGIYKEAIVKTIPYHLLKNYFKMGVGPNQGFFQAKDKLKKLIHFCPINLTREKEFPDETLNFIFCRNVFIYFDRQTQHKILKAFHRCLLPKSILFLGHSESINAKSYHETGTWRPLKHTIYQRVP